MHNMKRLLTLLFIAGLFACNDNTDHPPVDTSLGPVTAGIPAPVTLTYNVIAQHAHDTSAYTQGLQLYNGKLYEATGDFENSSLRITDIPTGRVEQIHKMGTNKIFGEGITILNDSIYQLTWQSHIVYVYSIKDISKPVKTFNWPYEGWGITNDGKELIVSDGSSNIYFVNPTDFKIRTMVGVQSNSGPVTQLNELEYIDGFVYANVYTTNTIVKIEPESGHVVGMLNFNNLLQPTDVVENRTDYFNGIAWNPETKIMYVTGKRWPKLFEIRLN